MSYLSWLLVAGLLTVGVGSQAAAAPQIPPYFELDPIVVTATRTETELSLIGSAVEIINGDELRSRGASTLLEALASVPGVVITRNGPAAGTGSVLLRGAKGEHLLVLVDGVEVNDPLHPGGSFDWNVISTDAIERIEVVKGPQSTLYGSDAIAGVIHIITRRIAEPGRMLTLEAGSYGTLNATASLSGSLAGTGYLLDVGRRQLGRVSSASDRYSGNTEPDEWRMWSGAVRLNRSLGSGEVTATIRGSRSGFDIDDFGGPFGDDPNSRSWKADLSGTIAYRSDINAGWEQRLLLGGSRTHRWGRDPSDSAHPDEESNSDFRGRIQTGEWHHAARLGRHRLAFGASVERESGSSSYRSSIAGFTYAERVPESSQWETALYLQDQFGVGASTVTAGGRLDRYTDYGVQPTFRLALSVPIGGLRARASLGSGFKAPSIYQRFSPLYGSADLEAERSTAWDLGVRLPIAGRGQLELGRYGQRVSDLIDFVTDPVTFLGRYANRGKVNLSGWEASARFAVSARLGLEGSLTRIETEDRLSNEPLLRRPERIVTLGVQVAPTDRLSALIRLRHVGKRDDRDFSSFPARRITLEAVTLVEGHLGYRVSDTLLLRLRMENLTDQSPEWVWGYGSRGRALYLGVVLNP
jgi:vitamin B12 transporter